MGTFAVTNDNEVMSAVNYLLSNQGQGTGNGNVVIPGNVLVANTATGAVTQYGNTDVLFYKNQFINLRYSNNATGTAGFSPSSDNYNYFGVYNSSTSTPSTNPAAYQWTQVSPGFNSASSRTLYYSSIGGRQIVFAAASSPPSSAFVVSTANVAIDLDIVTTANGTPGSRGPIPMGYVITTANPGNASTSTLTGWFEASRTANTPPIGTGLTPVDGDTAYFAYPTTGASSTFTYNGSTWISAVGQVVSGNTLVANTVTGTSLAPSTITGDKITGNTITGNLIVASTITGNLIAANTITGNTIQSNTITSNNIAANTIVANNIATGTLTTNLFTANTIQGNVILAGTITAEQLAANVLIANTVISTGATIGNFNSSGFWLQGSTGNARFGNTVSIGNQLTVGNNATIGGNLTVTGLISGGGLNSNTVSTNTVVPLSISSGAGVTTESSQIFSNLAQNTIVSSNLTLDFTTTENNQPLFVFAGVQAGVQFTTISGSVDVTGFFYLRRTNLSTGVITSLFDQIFDVNNVTTADGSTAFFYPTWTGVADTVPAAGTYRYSIAFQYGKTGTTSGSTIFYFLGRTWLVQTLKR
jgi:hypothetical protein